MSHTELINRLFRYKTLSIAIALSLFSTQAVAQENNQQVKADELEEVTVSDDAIDTDEKGKDDIYDLNLSTTFAGFEEVQRFKGATPSDIFNGMPSVFSGDARNSGGIDPNIRGVQGEGRVPVIIDGTEQAITVWRGYNGANNRNFIDTMLISNVQVEKGPSMTRGVHSSVGGAVVINTLDADDIIPEGKNFGFNIMYEGSNNSVSPRLPNLVEGQSIHDIPHSYPPNIPYNGLTFGLLDPEILKSADTGNRNSFGKDNAIRLALAKRWEDADITAAIVKRKRGNYYAGKKGWQDYYLDPSKQGHYKYSKNYTAQVANLFKPGNEVFNTSNDTTSFLLKGNWQPQSNTKFSLSLRHTDSKFGEIMPSRLDYYIEQGNSINLTDKKGNLLLPQWPEGRAKTTAVSFDWDYKPEDNKWINLETNLWASYNDLDTHTSGGYPRQGIYVHPQWYNVNPQIPIPPQWQYWNMINAWQQSNYMGGPFGPGTPTQIAATENLLSYSDVMDRLDTTMITSKTNSKDTRIGFNISNKMELDPKLDLTLGVAYQFRRLRSNDNWWNDRIRDYNKAVYDWFVAMSGSGSQALMGQANAGWNFRSHPREGTRHYAEATAKFDWRPNDKLELGAGLTFNYYNSFDDHIARMKREGVSGYENYSQPKKWHDTGWAPTLSGAFNITDSTRLYARLAQAVRHPSLFESTVGFSSSPDNVYLGNIDYGLSQLKSERATNFEIGVVQDLSSFLPNAEYADIKLTYYNNTIKNVIDRDSSFNFTNFDKQISRGLELQGRYDSGRFFTDISGTYNLKNMTCDAKHMQKLHGVYGDQLAGYGNNIMDEISKDEIDGNCISGGFPDGYLQNTVPPKFTWSLGLGARFMDNKLTIGTRMRHLSAARHNANNRISPYNKPIVWQKATILDAYIQYRDKDWSAELTGTNLTDRYYLDQFSRSLMPAPGRTVKLTFNKTF